MILADTTVYAAQSGISLGATIAVVCSWQRNNSIVLAAIAGFFSWFHVIYFAITRRANETQASE